MKPWWDQVFDAPFKGNIGLQNTLHKVMGLAAETGRDDVTARGISLNPPWLGYLIYHTLAKVIPYFYLWPTLRFNMCMQSNIGAEQDSGAGWHNSAASMPFPFNPNLFAVPAKGLCCLLTQMFQTMHREFRWKQQIEDGRGDRRDGRWRGTICCCYYCLP